MGVRDGLKFFLSLFILLFVTGCMTHVPSEPPVSYKKDTYQEQRKPRKQKRAPGHTKPYQIAGITYTPMATANGFAQTGKASWYGKKFHGRKTSNGETYDMYAMTAAHKTLPLDTWVKVQNLANNKTIVVRVNDRGPFVTGRIIDLSYTAAQRLGVVNPGTVPVNIIALGSASADPYTSREPVTFTPLNYVNGNFTVQVGAFSDKRNAERLRKKLSKVYDNAHITFYTDDRGNFYRVRVGKYSTIDGAENFGRKLISMGAATVFTVAE